jgi:septum formation protein
VTLILASGSVSRQRLLSLAGVPFTAIPADIDEGMIKDDLLGHGVPPGDIPASLALAKARHVSQLQPGALVLGADQILIFEQELVSKCPDLKAARALLVRLRGRPHRLGSAMALVRDGVTVWQHGDRANLKMRDFSDAFLDAYIASEGEGILSAVGCYKLEGLGAQLFEKVEGDYFSILGLPLQPLLAELRRQGVIAT